MTILYREKRSISGSSGRDAAASRPAGQPQDNASLPRVSYGWYRAGDKHVPLWAYSIAQLNQEERERAELLALLWPADAEIHAQLRAKFAQFRAELLRQQQGHGAHTRPRKDAAPDPDAIPKPAKATVTAPPVIVPVKPAAVPNKPATAPANVAAAAPLPTVTAPTRAADVMPAEPLPALPAAVAVARQKGESLGAKIAALRDELKQKGEPDIRPWPVPDASAPAAPAEDAPAQDAPAQPEPAVAPPHPVMESDTPSQTHPPQVVPSVPPIVARAKPTLGAVPRPAPKAAPALGAATARKTVSAKRGDAAGWFKTSYRSRRPCLSCGGPTRYVANFATIFTGLYRRVCKSCAFRELSLVKIHEVDKPAQNA